MEENKPLENQGESIKKVSGMYQEWFLDYASYVILERAIPALNDGLKPVQRRILHSMRELEDGRYNKVANVVGNAMKYHPHGDMAITDAMVQLGQKDLLIDTQGNWGNILTGDSAAASRYIEARLTKFALEVVFNPKTTHWQASYDGRNKEPIHFPVKFPLLLAQGVEGIAVGLSTKILPHNFNELIDASINYLRGKKFELFPDFLTGGEVDVSNYNEGKRGGKVKVRAKLKIVDKDTIEILDIPYGTTTGSLIDSILRANDKGKIKVKKIEDNTADKVSILVHLASGVSPNKMIDALYAFTDCEISISPNACVIVGDKPEFLSVADILKSNTDNTVSLLKRELEIKLSELQEQWHFSSLERIFIEHRIYRDIEEQETWEGVISAIDKGLKPHIKHLIREVTEEDIVRLTEIRIKKISKFDLDKAAQHIESLEQQMAEVRENLEKLIPFTIDYYKNLKKKYGKGRERKTEIKTFQEIDATKVVINNTKFYINKEEGFIGSGLKKDEFLFECSDIDDIIVFHEDGTMHIVKVESKTFVGKGILHVAVWKKSDKRTVYNLIYRDGDSGNTYQKRFNVTSITRNKEYSIANNSKKSKVLYFSANPNGEAEVVQVLLRSNPKLKKLKLLIDFSELAIKGRSVKGNLVSKHAVRKVELKEKGLSTLAPRKIWYDESVRRLNTENRGRYLGAFRPEDKILKITEDGTATLEVPDLVGRYSERVLLFEKWNPEIPLTCIYYHGEKQRYYVKRFELEDTSKSQVFYDLQDNESFIFSILDKQHIVLELNTSNKKAEVSSEEIILEEFVTVKGINALGNQLTQKQVKDLKVLKSENLLEQKDEISSEEIIEEIDDSDAVQGELF